MGADPERLLLAGGRYDPRELLEGWRREELQGCSEEFQRAMAQAWTLLRESRDPQQADLLLDRSCYQEMERLAKALGSPFLLGYVRLSVDVANLRTAVREMCIRDRSTICGCSVWSTSNTTTRTGVNPSVPWSSRRNTITS